MSKVGQHTSTVGHVELPVHTAAHPDEGFPSAAAALPVRTQSSTSVAWNFHRRPTLWAGIALSAIQE